VLPGHGRTDDGEDAGADDRADAERGERPRPKGLLQRAIGFLRLADELVNRLAGKQLVGQVDLLKCSFQLSANSPQRTALCVDAEVITRYEGVVGCGLKAESC